MLYLNKNDSDKLNKIKELILGNASLQEIVSCTVSIKLANEPNFPYVYAGFLFGGHDRPEDALSILNFVKLDRFADVIKNYIVKHGSLDTNIKVFSNASPYTAWTKTITFRDHRKGVMEAIAYFGKNFPPAENNNISIIDIGTGNGILISDIINKIAISAKLNSVDLVLLDQSDDMLKNAIEHCSSHINIPCTSSTICCNIRKPDEKQYSDILKHVPYYFANASLSIHHMPADEKLNLLKDFRKITKYFIIEEMNSNHDIPEKDTPELLFALYKSYRWIFEDIYLSSLTEDERTAAIEQFFFAEAIKIIRMDRQERIDYHTTIEDWERIAAAAGFRVEKVFPCVVRSEEIISFTMILS